MKLESSRPSDEKKSGSRDLSIRPPNANTSDSRFHLNRLGWYLHNLYSCISYSGNRYEQEKHQLLPHRMGGI